MIRDTFLTSEKRSIIHNQQPTKKIVTEFSGFPILIKRIQKRCYQRNHAVGQTARRFHGIVRDPEHPSIFSPLGQMIRKESISQRPAIENQRRCSLITNEMIYIGYSGFMETLESVVSFLSAARLVQKSYRF
jgi:hypothetical protein